MGGRAAHLVAFVWREGGGTRGVRDDIHMVMHTCMHTCTHATQALTSIGILDLQVGGRSLLWPFVDENPLPC